MILNAYSLQSKYLTFFQSLLYALPVSGILRIRESCCKPNQYPDITGRMSHPLWGSGSCPRSACPLQGEWSYQAPSQALVSRLLCVRGGACLERPLGAGVGVQAESGVEKGSGRREGQPGHRPMTAIWVCGAPSWPGNLLSWKLTISEHLGRIQPLKTVHLSKGLTPTSVGVTASSVQG